MKCAVCRTEIAEPVYESASKTAISSLTQLSDMRTRVWLCGVCSHLTSDPLPDNQKFYEFEYQISLGSEDEDQVYEVVGDTVVYRHDHQTKVFYGKVDVSSVARVLDYGCAKGTMMRALKRDQPQTAIHLFDVSRDYEPHWRKITDAEKCAVHEIPSSWNGSFDLVTSFFSMEHIPDPNVAMANIAALLRPNGRFYCVVPYTLTNIADFLVVDHVNHFTASSMHQLLQAAGFENIALDTVAHRGALVVTATLGTGTAPIPEHPSTKEAEAARRLAAYWSSSQTALRESEREAGGAPSAIYGAGFYGIYVHTTLADPGRVTCFIDRSPFLQGKEILGKPVIHPANLSPEVTAVYFGLNPSIAETVANELQKQHPQLKHLVCLTPFEI